MARKRRRRREKAVLVDSKDHPVHGDLRDEQDKTEDASIADISEVIVPYVVVRTNGKVRSMDWADRSTKTGLQLLIATTNNQLEVFNIPAKQKEKKSESDGSPRLQPYLCRRHARSPYRCPLGCAELRRSNGGYSV